MNARKILFIAVLVGLALASCAPAPVECVITVNTPVTMYRLPDETSDVFSTLGSADMARWEARTADGWYGLDPGIAQAANVGLYRLRWVRDTISFTPSCADDLPLVTLEDVLTDQTASGGG